MCQSSMGHVDITAHLVASFHFVVHDVTQESMNQGFLKARERERESERERGREGGREGVSVCARASTI